jgi:hypothetical protein
VYRQFYLAPHHHSGQIAFGGPRGVALPTT